MRHGQTPATSSALALGLAVGACGGPPASVSADASTELARSVTMAPGGFAEANLALPAGAAALARFATDGAPVCWDVHSHDDGLEIVAAGTGASGELPLAPTRGGRFSYLWENLRDDAVRLDVTLLLEGGATLEAWTDGLAAR